MSKLLPHIVKPLFWLFVLAVGAGVMYFSFTALGLIFPGDLAGQLLGLTLFDVSMVVWFLVFVSKSESTMQYVFSAFGFLAGLAGTIVLVGFEVGSSSGMIEAGSFAKPLTYTFVGVLIGHLLLTYAFHASAPEVADDISLGIDKAKVRDKAKELVEKSVEEQLPQLAGVIAADLLRGVLRDLNIPANDKQVIDLPALDVTEETKAAESVGGANFLSWLPLSWAKGVKKWNTNAMSVESHLPVETPKPSPAPQSAGSEEAEELKSKKPMKRYKCPACEYEMQMLSNETPESVVDCVNCRTRFQIKFGK